MSKHADLVCECITSYIHAYRYVVRSNMHEYNSLYTVKFIEHVLTPEALFTVRFIEHAFRKIIREN